VRISTHKLFEIDISEFLAFGADSEIEREVAFVDDSLPSAVQVGPFT
jgi:hypothetical protein